VSQVPILSTIPMINYVSSEDLAGLKVSHDLDALQEGEDRILTLKDSRILDNEGPREELCICFLCNLIFFHRG